MCLNTEFFSGSYFPVFVLNTGIYGPEKTPYFDTFHTMNHACFTDIADLKRPEKHVDENKYFELMI